MSKEAPIREHALKTSQVIWSELRRRLPAIAEKLGVKPEEVALYNFWVFPYEFMRTEQRDVIVDTWGPIEGIPHVNTVRRNDPRYTVGWGVTFYKNRRHENLMYAAYTQRGAHGDIKYLIVPKKDVFKLWRAAKAAEKEASQKADPPILADGLLDKIVKNTIGFLQKSKEIEKYGVRIKRGIILEGEPGNGKTMACRYIQKLCSQNGYDWGVITSSDLDAAYEENELSELFQRYTVSFFDDIDIQYLDRSKGNGKMACSLLTAMDGMSERGHVVRIFTTNENVETLDKAFTRPGRIDAFINLKRPTPEMIRSLVTEKWPEEIRNHIDIEQLVRQCRDFSFAEVEAIRTLLVTEKIVNEGVWDLNKAFKEFAERKSEKGTLGFSK